MHYHGNDFSVIAVDGRLLSSDGGPAGPDLAYKGSTLRFVPGQTADLLWDWTGAEIGWDPYGHTPGDDPLVGYEYSPDDGATYPDHLVPFPVVLAERDDPVIRQIGRPSVEDKGPDSKFCDRGKFLNPTAYGYPEIMGRDYRRYEAQGLRTE